MGNIEMSKADLANFIDEFGQELIDQYRLSLLDPVEHYIERDETHENAYCLFANILTKNGERTVKVCDSGYFYDEGLDDDENFWTMADVLGLDTEEKQQELLERMKRIKLIDPNFNPEI